MGLDYLVSSLWTGWNAFVKYPNFRNTKSNDGLSYEYIYDIDDGNYL